MTNTFWYRTLYFTMKKLSIIVASILLLIVSTNSFAETATDEANITTQTSSPSSRLKNPREPKAPLKTLIKINKEGFKERIASSQARFKEKLAGIKDEKKQKIVENINERLQSINETKTSNFFSVLERLNNLLANFKMESTDEKFQDSDKTAFLKEVTEAEEKIASSDAVIATQAENDYTLTIEDEETLRQTVGETVSQFKKDLVATYQTVITAKKEVRDVAAELTKLKQTLRRTTNSIN